MKDHLRVPAPRCLLLAALLGLPLALPDTGGLLVLALPLGLQRGPPAGPRDRCLDPLGGLSIDQRQNFRCLPQTNVGFIALRSLASMSGRLLAAACCRPTAQEFEARFKDRTKKVEQIRRFRERSLAQD